MAGDFQTSYKAGDNSKVVPTDTIKTTVNVFAKERLAEDLKAFAPILGDHFVSRSEQVSEATIEAAEPAWNRLEIGGKPHPQTFEAGSEARRFARAVCRADSSELSAGIHDLVILKSTGSGFEGFPKCEYTTLPETADRAQGVTDDALPGSTRRSGSISGQTPRRDRG